MSAILFGSISTLADTSELQREAFNKAFAAAGLDWQWEREDYRAMLDSNGGQARIAAYADSRGQDVDAKALHEAKSAIFQESLAAADLAPRDGVLDTIRAAKSDGWQVGLVTTTSPANVAALLASLEPDVRQSDFDVVVDVTDVEEPKPAGAAYTFALDKLGAAADACVAVEDNPGGVAAAAAAGVACVAFPNQNTAGHDFSAAATSVDRLDPAELRRLGGE